MSNNESRPSRRAALLGDRPGSYAIARHVRMSPTKVRRVVDVVRGMDVEEALAVNPDEWHRELPLIEEWLQTCGPKVPAEVHEQFAALKDRLG